MKMNNAVLFRILEKVVVNDKGCWVYQTSSNNDWYAVIAINGKPLMTNDEMFAQAKDCLVNMVNSMTTWRAELMVIFHQLYSAKFCIHCGRVRTYYQGMPESCICEDIDF